MPLFLDEPVALCAIFPDLDETFVLAEGVFLGEELMDYDVSVFRVTLDDGSEVYIPLDGPITVLAVSDVCLRDHVFHSSIDGMRNDYHERMMSFHRGSVKPAPTFPDLEVEVSIFAKYPVYLSLLLGVQKDLRAADCVATSQDLEMVQEIVDRLTDELEYRRSTGTAPLEIDADLLDVAWHLSSRVVRSALTAQPYLATMAAETLASSLRLYSLAGTPEDLLSLAEENPFLIVVWSFLDEGFSSELEILCRSRLGSKDATAHRILLARAKQLGDVVEAAALSATPSDG